MGRPVEEAPGYSEFESERPKEQGGSGTHLLNPVFTSQRLPSLRNMLCGKGYLRGVVSGTLKERAKLGAGQPQTC